MGEHDCESLHFRTCFFARNGIGYAKQNTIYLCSFFAKVPSDGIVGLHWGLYVYIIIVTLADLERFVYDFCGLMFVIKMLHNFSGFVKYIVPTEYILHLYAYHESAEHECLSSQPRGFYHHLELDGAADLWGIHVICRRLGAAVICQPIRAHGSAAGTGSARPA